MTRVVELVINAAQDGIAEQDIQAGLSKLYGKPPEHFDKLIHQVCTVKQPYTLLKEVKEEVASKHIARLEKIGLDCSMEMSLSLVPVGGESDSEAAPGKPTCPVCKEPTSSQETCSSCGVDLRKATSARQSADAIQRTLESAEQELKNKKKQQTLEAEKQRKEKEDRAAREKAEAAKKEAEKPPVKDIFTAEYADEDEDKKRKIKLAGAAAVVAAGVIAFSTGTFTSDPDVTTEAASELAGTDDVETGAAAEPGTENADGTTAVADTDSNATSPTTDSGAAVANAGGAPQSPAASPQGSAAMTQNIVAAATAKVEAGTPSAGAADDFDDTIAKFEKMAEMQGDGRSAEQVANDLFVNANNNKAIFQQVANKTGAPGGTLQMPSSLNAAGGVPSGDAASQVQAAGVSSLQEMLAKYSSTQSGSAGGPGTAPTTTGDTGTGSYQDAYLDHWVGRQAKADRLVKLVNKFIKQDTPEHAHDLVANTGDGWLAIHGHHKLAIAEQLSGDGDGSHSRMMNLFVDLMAVQDLPEKIAALADHAQTWHLMLNTAESENAFDQMRSLAAAPMKPRQEIVANVAMAESLKTTGKKRDARKHFDKALDATLSISNQNGARDEMIHFIVLAEAKSRFGDEALSHAGKIRNENLRRAAYQSLYQTFTRYGMDREATAALKKFGGSDMPEIDRAALEKMLQNGPKLSESNQ